MVTAGNRTSAVPAAGQATGGAFRNALAALGSAGGTGAGRAAESAGPAGIAGGFGGAGRAASAGPLHSDDATSAAATPAAIMDRYLRGTRITTSTRIRLVKIRDRWQSEPMFNPF
jgi:hypothetical protein